jgi:hypothetical protein
MSEGKEKLPAPQEFLQAPNGRVVLQRIYDLAKAEQANLDPKPIADFNEYIISDRLPTLEMTHAMVDSATNIGRFTVLLEVLKEFTPQVDTQET